MRKPILAICLCLSLGACGSTSILSGGLSLTAPVTQPITKKQVFQAEQGLIAIISGFQVYKNYCEKAPRGDKCEGIIAEIQTFTIPAAKVLKEVRMWLRQNNQVNAISAFNEFRVLITKAKASASANGVI